METRIDKGYQNIRELEDQEMELKMTNDKCQKHRLYRQGDTE